MPVLITCPNPDCQAVASIEEQSLGRKGRCKKCGHVFALVRPGGEAASAISGDASAWKRVQAARPANIPEQFGRYRIMKQLGQGGMGAVYLAHDIKLDRQVALKVPFFHPAEGDLAVQRFEREARAAATLDHPNLCPVFDVGEIDGIHYLTMPYIEGKPLSEAMNRDQTATEPQAAAVVRKLALALQEAHEKGIIHRDLKPGNIMINRRRELIIMDFGLARMIDGDHNPITKSGHALGTALYMAPEQAAGDINAIGPACDVYSLGVMLYELLTGQRPFEGPWSVVIGLKSVMDPDPPASHRPNLSPALNAICLKAIAKDPKDRYATMVEFAEALGAFLAVPAPTVPVSDASRSARSPESLAAQVFAGIITQEVASLRDERSSVRQEIARPKGASSYPPTRVWIITTSGAAAVLILGIISYMSTESGRIKPLGGDGGLPAHQPVIPIPAPESKPPLPPAASESSRWISLFNGKDLTGWKTHPSLPDAWRVRDGCLMGPDSRSYLYSERNDYRNFHLRVEARIAEGGNSGLYFHAPFGPSAPEVNRMVPYAYEATINPSKNLINGTGNLLKPSKTGDEALQKYTGPKAPPDVWFIMEVIVDGKHIVIKVNGLTTVDYIHGAMTAFSGHIVLQEANPSAPVEFRKIEIKELDDRDAEMIANGERVPVVLDVVSPAKAAAAPNGESSPR